MRYGFGPSGPLEWLALAVLTRTGYGVFPPADVVLAPIQTQAVLLAGKHGILKRLVDRAYSVEELAQSLGFERHCLRLVLRVLASMNYVRTRDDEVWELTPDARRYFAPGARVSFHGFLAFGLSVWRHAEKLEQVATTGRGIDVHAEQSPEEWEAYQRAMFENMMVFGTFIAKSVPVPEGATRCLDVAGSHGYLGALLCRKHPSLRSVVLDLPAANEVGRRLAEEHGYADVVSHQDGDLLKRAPLAGREELDVILVSNITHHFSEADNRDLLRRAYEALRPGGIVVIWDFEEPETTTPDIAAAFALYFRIVSAGRSFRGNDYRDWLIDAGFSASLKRAAWLPLHVLAIGTKPVPPRP